MNTDSVVYTNSEVQFSNAFLHIFTPLFVRRYKEYQADELY
jgi:hypothetical protein